MANRVEANRVEAEIIRIAFLNGSISNSINSKLSFHGMRWRNIILRCTNLKGNSSDIF